MLPLCPGILPTSLLFPYCSLLLPLRLPQCSPKIESPIRSQALCTCAAFAQKASPREIMARSLLWVSSLLRSQLMPSLLSVSQNWNVAFEGREFSMCTVHEYCRDWHIINTYWLLSKNRPLWISPHPRFSQFCMLQQKQMLHNSFKNVKIATV